MSHNESIPRYIQIEMENLKEENPHWDYYTLIHEALKSLGFHPGECTQLARTYTE